MGIVKSIWNKFLADLLQKLKEIGLSDGESLPNLDELDKKDQELIDQEFPVIFEAISEFLVNPHPEVVSNLSQWVHMVKNKQEGQQDEFEEYLLEKIHDLSDEGDITGLKRLKHKLKEQFSEPIATTVERNNVLKEKMEEGDRVLLEFPEEITYFIRDNKVLQPDFSYLDLIESKIEGIRMEDGEEGIEPLNLTKFNWTGDGADLKEVMYLLSRSGQMKPVDGSELKSEHISNWFNEMFPGESLNRFTNGVRKRCKGSKVRDAEDLKGDKVFWIEKQLENLYDKRREVKEKYERELKEELFQNFV